MIGPVARIVARYLIGAAVMYGLLGADLGAQIEPDVVLIVSAVLGAAVEGIYALARRRGWAT